MRASRVLGCSGPSTRSLPATTRYASAGHPADAIAQLEQVIDHLDHVLGCDHPRTLNARGNLAGAYAEAKQTSQAIALQERAVADFERVLGSDHPDTIIGRANMAIFYDSAGRTGDAIALLNRLVADSGWPVPGVSGTSIGPAAWIPWMPWPSACTAVPG